MGVGWNEPSENQSWAEDEDYEYEIWSDDDKTLALYYEAIKSEITPIPGRVTVILDEKGKLLLEYRAGTGDASHPQEVLEDCQALFGSSD